MIGLISPNKKSCVNFLFSISSLATEEVLVSTARPNYIYQDKNVMQRRDGYT
jgi:hypothetical protein